MRELTVAKYQLVEIVKAVSYNAEIIIMDEPTSALSHAEIRYLMDTVETLRREGKAIVFISHKMDEIYNLCSAVTVLRDGKFIYSGKVRDVPERELIRMMVDRNVDQLYPRRPRPSASRCSRRGTSPYGASSGTSPLRFTEARSWASPD